MASVLPKNIQNVLVNNMTTSSALTASMISTANLISGNATIPTILMTGSLLATHTTNTFGSIFTVAGNTGIGTTSPHTSLTVNTSGNISLTSTTFDTGKIIFGSALSSAYNTNHRYFIQRGGTIGNMNQLVIHTPNEASNAGVNFMTTNQVSRLFINSSSGNIGIGTTSPISTLDVVGTIDSDNLVVTNASIATANFTGITANNINFTGNLYQNGAVYISSQWTSGTGGTLNYTTGNIGINTTAPTYTLDINGSLRATSGDVTLSNLRITTLISSSNLASNLITVGTLQVSTINNTLLNATGNSNTLGNLFTTSGNVGIGTGIAPERLTVSGTILVTNGNLQISNGLYTRNSITIEQYGSNFLVSSPTTGSNVTILQNTGGGGLSLQPGGGNIGIGTTSASVKLQVEDGSIIIGDSAYVSTSVPSAPGTLTTANGYRLFFDNSHNGTAGIGIPANKIVLHNNNFVAGFGVESASVTYHSGYSHTFYGNATNTSTYGNATMMINGNGNIGIATTNPQTTLHINGPGLQMGSSTNAFHIFNTRASLYLLTGSSGAGTNVAAFTSTGNVGIGTTAPIFTLDTPGTIRASSGMLISGNSTLEFGHNISGKEMSAGKIGYNSFAATGLTLVGAGTGSSNRLVYIYDHLQVSDSITVANLRTTSTLNAAGNATIQITTNNYTLTSGSLNVTGDIVLSGTELMFTTTGVSPPTMNGRDAGSKIVLYPRQASGSGDYSIGIENGNTWFQVPTNNYGYKFYQGTSANVVIGTNGNLGIGTVSPTARLDVNGHIAMPLASRLTTAVNDNFIYSGTTVGHYSLSWNNDPSTAIGPMSYLSGYGGIRLFTTGAPRVNILDNGNVGIATTSPTTAKLVIGGSAAATGLDLASADQYAELRVIRNALSSIDKDMYLQIGAGTGSKLRMYSNNIETMTLNGGSVGIGTTSPSAKLHVVGNAGNSIFEGADHTYLQFYPFGFANGRKTWLGFGNSNNKDFTIYNEATSGSIILNTAAAGGSIQFNNHTTMAMTITGGNVGIGTASPAYLLDVNGTIDALTVTTGNLSTGTSTIGTLLNTTLINYGLGAQWVMNGGGNVTWTGSNVLWNTRIIVIPVKKTEYGSAGHFDINCPTSGTITFYNSANVTTTATCTASGIPISGWNALYYEITPGQANTSDQTKFRLVDFSNSTWKPTSNWLLIAVVNGDSSSLKWIPGNTYIPTGKIFYGDSTNNWQINGTTNYIPKFNAANTLTANSQIFDNGTNVGIGTASPSDTLTVNGNIRLGPAADSNADYYIKSSGQLTISANDASTQDASFTSLSLTSGVSSNLSVITVVGSSTLKYMSFATSNTERMRIDSSGNVGIGTSAPTTAFGGTITNTRLTLKNESSNTSVLLIGGGNNHYSYIEGSHIGGGATYLSLGTCNAAVNPTEKMRITATGDIGIGTPTPTYKLDIKGNRLNLHNVGTGGGENLFEGLENSTSRAQIVLSSMYSDMVIASSQANENHGSTLTFASYNPSNKADYRKWVVNQGNWGARVHMLEFGYSSTTVNPHDSITDTNTLLTLDGSNKRIGIGTRNPGYKLDINGSGRFVDGLTIATGQPSVFTNRTITSNPNFGLIYCADRPAGNLGSHLFCNSNATANYVSMNTPSFTLDVNGTLRVLEASGTAAGANSGSIILDHDNSGGASSITFRSKVNRGSDYAYIQYQDAATVGGAGEVGKLIIGVQNDADDHIILDPSGSVGIGTYSPSFKLHVNGNMRGNEIYNNGWFRNYGDTGLYNEDYACSFVRNDAQYGNWKIAGNVINNWNGLRFTQAEISLMAGEGANKVCGFHYNNVGWAMMLDASRNLFVTGNITAYWSDKRLKTNFRQLSHFDNVLTSLTGYTFNWNEKGQEITQHAADYDEVGLIAQDVQAVIPQAVNINKAGASADDTDSFDYLTINYDKIVPFLIEGYKSQRSEIHELKSKVQRLEELVQQLLDK
jgi:hypothetical protein